MKSAPVSSPRREIVSSEAWVCWSMRSSRIWARSSEVATNRTMPLLISSRSISFTNMEVSMCSELRLRIAPTITTGSRCWSDEKRCSHGRLSMSSIISSATSRASVSFQRPLRSVCVSALVRCTVRLGVIQPLRTSVTARPAISANRFVVMISRPSTSEHRYAQFLCQQNELSSPNALLYSSASCDAYQPG